MRQVHLDSSLDLPGCVVAVGSFDGVHVGHATVLATAVRQAEQLGLPSVVVTFDPHPRTVISPDRAPGVLTSLSEKAWRMAGHGIDVLAVVAFTTEVRNLTPDAFVERFLVGMLDVRLMVLGYDHGIGRDRSGGLDSIRSLGDRFGFGVIQVPPTTVGGAPVSSTRIRACIEEGELEEARLLLGGGYPVGGRVVAGDGRGRELGFPTANVLADDAAKLMPPDGVYAAWAHIPEPCSTVLNLGSRPTFNGRARGLEAHLIGQDVDLYNRDIVVEFEHRIREERRFESAEALIAQIRQDCETAQAFLSKQEPTLLRR